MNCGTNQTAPAILPLLATTIKNSGGYQQLPTPPITGRVLSCYIILAYYSAKQFSTSLHPPSYSAKPIKFLTSTCARTWLSFVPALPRWELKPILGNNSNFQYKSLLPQLLVYCS